VTVGTPLERSQMVMNALQIASARRGKTFGISLHTQLLLITMTSAVLIVAGFFGAPLIPAVTGALGAGVLLYIRHHRPQEDTPPDRRRDQRSRR